jgi:UDP-N-acetylglucosamine acyltransferase
VIDPHAIVSPQAELAADVTVGPFSVIGPQVRIGPGTVVGPHVVINGPTTIGADNRIHQFASLGDAPHDNLFMAYSHVAHDCVVGCNTVFANCVSLGGHVEIGDWVILGGLSAVHQHCKIGAHAFLAGGSIITRDVPPYVMVAGNHAVPHAINSEGLKRRGFTEEQVRAIREAYRLVYRCDLKLSEALERLEPSAAERPELRLFADFIRSSTRSIVR